MTIREAINQEEEIKKNILIIIHSMCGEYLNEVKSAKGLFIYRGSPSRPSNYVIKTSRLLDRRPMNTPEGLHNFINKFFHMHFGWPARNGVFASADADSTEFYGMPCLFFPVGNYKYVWSPKVSDLYGSMYQVISSKLHSGEELMKFNLHKWYEQNPEQTKEAILPMLKTYVDNNLVKAIVEHMPVNVLEGKKPEISFNCQSYILVNTNYRHFLEGNL